MYSAVCGRHDRECGQLDEDFDVVLVVLALGCQFRPARKDGPATWPTLDLRWVAYQPSNPITRSIVAVAGLDSVDDSA
jgi:hypothetical protein